MSFRSKNILTKLINKNWDFFFSGKNKPVVCCSTHSHIKSKNKQFGTSYKIIKYGVLIASAVIGYNVLKDINMLPLAYASTKNRKTFNFIADAVEKCAPSVVYIEIKDSRRLDFFTGKPMTISNGSGFIIQANGLILTNAHVVTNKPNARVDVRLQNGVTYNGIVEDIDIQSDLATVRIQATNLPVMSLGNSSELRPGEFVVAIGSPLALSNTVTSGVVSSTHRDSEELGLHGKDMIYIQTDAAITFGNSGGPLVNLDSEAIGVNSMKVTAGISFAIPINYVKTFLANTNKKASAIENAKKRYMGITMLTLTPQILFEMHLRDRQIPSGLSHGVLVWKVIIGSPAHSGGLQPGDIVTEMNNIPIKTANDIYTVLCNSKPGPLSMTVIRLGKTFNVFVTPEDLS